ncbi:hypothetical protein FZ029_13415 [Azospirillum sp. Sh1]|nr:hypothetical protein FZ029_13415 [Azospirillum sp. Sh1]
MVGRVCSGGLTGQSHLKAKIPYKDFRHPREGGDPGNSGGRSLRRLDSRLRGNDKLPCLRSDLP